VLEEVVGSELGLLVAPFGGAEWQAIRPMRWTRRKSP